MATFIRVTRTSEKKIYFFFVANFSFEKNWCCDTREKVRACAHVPNSGIWQFSQKCENAHSYPRVCKFVQKSAQIGEKVGFFDPKRHTFCTKSCFFQKRAGSYASEKNLHKAFCPRGKNPPIYTVLNAAFSAPTPPCAAPWWDTPPRRPVFDPVETRRPAGARVPDAATPVAPFYFFY